MEVHGLTEKQRIVWETILKFQADQESLPTLKEIRTRGSMTSGILVDRLGALIARGFVERHGRTYKALPPPHEAIIGRICETCRTSVAAVLGDSKAPAAVRARKLITKELRARNYYIGDIAALLNKYRNTIYYYGQPAKRAARNAYGKKRRDLLSQASSEQRAP